MTELERLKQKEAERADKQDARMSKNGSKYKAVIWVHPELGGDDYQIDFYFREKPSKEKVKRLASREGSAILTDFVIKEL